MRLKHTSSKNVCVFLRMCFSSVNSEKFFLRVSSFLFTSRSSFSSFSKVAFESNNESRIPVYCSQWNRTSRSIISRGCGASGFSPVSSIGIWSFFISLSRYPEIMISSLSYSLGLRTTPYQLLITRTAWDSEVLFPSQCISCPPKQPE